MARLNSRWGWFTLFIEFHLLFLIVAVEKNVPQILWMEKIRHVMLLVKYIFGKASWIMVRNKCWNTYVGSIASFAPSCQALCVSAGFSWHWFHCRGRDLVIYCHFFFLLRCSCNTAQQHLTYVLQSTQSAAPAKHSILPTKNLIHGMRGPTLNACVPQLIGYCSMKHLSY